MSEKHRPGYMPWDRSGNRILMQSSLGKSKPTNYDIPDENFVYGKATATDPEKANEVIYKWLLHECGENPKKGKEKDLIATNKKALRSLLHTASDFTKFRKNETLYKPVKQGSNKMDIRLPEENFTYGKPGELEDPIKLVLANDYGETDKMFRHTLYQSQLMQKQVQKKKLGCHITKNHNLVKKATAQRLQKFNWARRTQDKQQWKLTKFTSTAQHKVDDRRMNKSTTEIKHH